MSNRHSFQLFNWHLEVSSKCFLKCPRCLRTEEAGNYEVKELSLEFIKNNFSSSFIKKNVHRVTFSGGLGDPIYNSNLLEIIEYFKSASLQIQIVIVTNGSYREEQWWMSLSNLMTSYDEIIFSIDGWDQASNEIYRINSNWESIMCALRVVTKSKALIRWSTIAFSFNMKKINDIADLSETLGCDVFVLTFSDRFGSTYPAYNCPISGLDDLEPDAEYISKNFQTKRFKKKFKSKKWVEYYRFFDTFNLLYEKQKVDVEKAYEKSNVIPTCMYGWKGAYIDVDGFYYPCSWISHFYSHELESNFQEGRKDSFEKTITPIKDQLNLHIHGLEKVLKNEIWNKLQKDWQENRGFVVCEMKCGKSLQKDQCLETEELN